MNKVLLTRNGIIGRSEEADYRINYSSISRNHCEIKIKEEGLLIKDLGSKNGTFVNDSLIKEALLREGDNIRFGEVHFVVERELGVFMLSPFNIEQETEVQAVELHGSRAVGEYNDDYLTYFGENKGQAVEETKSAYTQLLKADQKGQQGEASELIAAALQIAEDNFERLLADVRRKLACQALLIIELSGAGSVIREESIKGDFVLSTAVIEYMKQRMAASTILMESEMGPVRESGYSDDYVIRGIWAPRQLKQDSMSLAGAADNSVYCVPLSEYNKKQVILYAYWKGGCISTRRSEKIIQHEGKNIVLFSRKRWMTMDSLNAQEKVWSMLSEPLIGSSAEFLSVMENVSKLAVTDFSVVLLGPRGSGKTTIARAVHEMSHRKNNPFMAFNCANFQPSLVEAELFGSRRGAYTGATDRKGCLREADGGTIFIDSLESCPMEVQAKLRDVLEGRAFRAVGGDRDERVNVRFIAAINEDPGVLQNESRLRADFWDRIGVQFITVPHLWQRSQDIPALAFHFLERESKKCIYPVKLKGFSPEAIKSLQTYYWPGNVRELSNVVSRLIVFSPNEIASSHDVWSAINILKSEDEFTSVKGMFDFPYNKACIMFSSLYLLHQLKMSDNKISYAAERANLTRKTFYNLLDKCGIRIEEKKFLRHSIKRKQKSG